MTDEIDQVVNGVSLKLNPSPNAEFAEEDGVSQGTVDVILVADGRVR